MAGLVPAMWRLDENNLMPAIERPGDTRVRT
jgi:hypothetical protein